MTKVIDFDAFRAEQNAEPIQLKIGGKIYELPSALPASLALEVIRMNSADSGIEIPADKLETLGRGIMGGDTFDRIMNESNLTIEELPELFKMVFEVYNGAPDAPNPESPEAESTPETPTSL